MFCIYCGKKIDGGQFCIYCGKKTAPPINNQSQNIIMPVNRYTTPAPVQHHSKKGLIAVIGAVAVILLVVIVVNLGKPKDTYSIPYNNNPYTNGQGLVPPADFSYELPDDYYNGSGDSYSYGSSTQICISCHGSGYCPICHGTGQYSMYGNELSECTACDGTGICSICDGDGVY